MKKNERFTVTYRITASTYEEAKAIAFSIQVEQTVEVPYEFLPNEWFKEVMVGQLLEIREIGNHSYIVAISYPVEATAYEVNQFLNVVFGNSSLQSNIWVEQIELCPSLWEVFSGPRWGIAGIRELVQVPLRPMLQTVIKPLGSSVESLALMCEAYAAGGVDIIKDDHGITNQIYAPFKERVCACVEAVARGMEKSGKPTLYAPNVSGDGTQTIERAYMAKELGATAIMVSPGLVGFGMMHQLANDTKLNMPILSHPAFSGGAVVAGTSGIDFGLWFGLLNRLCGADISIFVSYGGRFSFTKESCQRAVAQLLDTTLPIQTACPCSGGGVSEKRLPELMANYGSDMMYLIGGDMFRKGPDLQANTEFFVNMLENFANL